MIGLKNSRHFLNQSWLVETRFPALDAGSMYICLLRVLIGSRIVSAVVIGQSDYFGFTALDLKPLLLMIILFFNRKGKIEAIEIKVEQRMGNKKVLDCSFFSSSYISYF